jgi:hypothetical protein
MLVDAASGGGMELQGALCRKNGATVLDLTIANKGAEPLSRFEIRFNKNSFQLNNAGGAIDIGTPQLNPGQVVNVDVPLTPTGPAPGTPVNNKVQIAVRNSANKVAYGTVTCPLTAVLTEDGKLESRNYLDMWRTEITNENEVNETIYGVRAGPDGLRDILQNYRIFFVAKTKSKSNNDVLYFSMKTVLGLYVLLEFAFGEGSANACVKCANPAFASLLLEELKTILA